MNEHHDFPRLVYLGLAALAGSITALSMMNWKTMPWADVAMTLFVGISFAVFAVPYLAADWAGIPMSNLRGICFATYMGATGANVFIPMLMRKIRKQGGEGEA